QGVEVRGLAIEVHEEAAEARVVEELHVAAAHARPVRSRRGPSAAAMAPPGAPRRDDARRREAVVLGAQVAIVAGAQGAARAAIEGVRAELPRAAQHAQRRGAVVESDALEVGDVARDRHVTSLEIAPDIREHFRALLRLGDRRGEGERGEHRRCDPCLHPGISRYPAMERSVLAISTATRAASAPFTGARSFACSSFSVVRTPLAMGMHVSSCMSRMPRAHSVATISKWKVSPRITAPSATSAS